LEEAREQVAGLISARPEETFFTSGATESNNLAIRGFLEANRDKGNHLIFSEIEHYSVLNDAACAAGIIPVDVDDLGVDALTLSGHNFYGPKGVGALYLRSGEKLSPLFQGGFQENGLRPGTENLPAIVGFGEASRLAQSEMGSRINHLRNLGKILKGGLEKAVDFLHLTGHPEKRLPGHVSLWIEYVEGESLLLMLNLKGVMAASGSACSSNLKGRDETDLAASHVLTAVGVPPEFCTGSLTFSTGKDNTEEEVSCLLEIMPPIVKRLLEMSPLYADSVRAKTTPESEF